VLVELSVVEQRHHAVMEVLAGGVPVTEVAERYGVSRKSVHAWLDRYRAECWPACRIGRIARMRASFPVSRRVEAQLVGMRPAHPRSGPRRLLCELAKSGNGAARTMCGGSAWRRCSCGRPRIALNVKRG
jgi:uncharacterized protein YjcR